MNLREMSYLVAVADLRNFTHAAEHCHVSQPTLSAQIRKMEESLDVKIFERNNKHVMITEEGKEIIQSAEKILLEMARIKEVAEHAHNPFAGKFRLGAFPTLATYIFPEIVPQIKNEMPELHLILIEDKTAELIERLRKGEIDAAFLALPVHGESLTVKALFDDNFLLAVSLSHPLAKMTEMNVDTLAQYQLLLLEEGHCLRDHALEVCHKHNIGEEQDFRATSLETLRLMVKAGTGITMIPEIAINHAETDIRYIPFMEPKPYRTIAIVCRKTSTKKEIVKYIESILVKSRLS